MKVILYSRVFYPSVGGVETITDTLASNITNLGHDCIVVTEIESNEDVVRNYKVIRNPSFFERIRLVLDCDVVHSNGASMALFFHAKICKKPFIWTHNGYQVCCIDGLGWVDGKASPLKTVDSIKFHLRNSGVYFTFKETLKLYMRKLVSNYVDQNVSATKWVNFRQPLRNQIQAYTPYPLRKFANISTNDKIYDFIYVGRLVSEKGVSVLLRAFHGVVQKKECCDAKLLVVGDGDWRGALEDLCVSLNIQKSVEFSGKKIGEELLELISKSEIAIVPSEWEEPMGGVALELLSAGKSIIVSHDGGLRECVGDAGLTFPNGDCAALQLCMETMLSDDELRRMYREKSVEQTAKFDEIFLTRIYIDLYENIVNNPKK